MRLGVRRPGAACDSIYGMGCVGRAIHGDDYLPWGRWLRRSVARDSDGAMGFGQHRLLDRGQSQYYEEALTSAREAGDQRGEGNWLGNLGLAYRDLDQVDLARQYLDQSLAIFELINSPSADVIRDWLSELEDA